MMAPPNGFAQPLSRIPALAIAGRPGFRRPGTRAGPAAAAPALPVLDLPGLLAALRVIMRLATSRLPEHRAVAAALAAETGRADSATARAIARTISREPDLRAEKIISRSHRFLWICNPKVASRSIIDALLSAASDAELVTDGTLDEIFAARPETRGYYSFAFIRDPRCRTFSCYADKLATLARSGQPDALCYFVERFHGVRPDMAFAEFCRWLNTPYGSDLFADRHWLSQCRQIRLPDGRLPDFIGRYERLDADWRTVTAHLGLPARPLPHMNARSETMGVEEHLDDETVALLTRRYAEDFRLGGYGA